jgi:hypothetical protein
MVRQRQKLETFRHPVFPKAETLFEDFGAPQAIRKTDD